MRKIYAYIVSVVTLFALIAFSVPTIKDKTRFSMEYSGGFEVLYKVKSNMDGVSDNKVASTISDGMEKMLDINRITNSIVNVESGNYIRVNLTSKNQIISDQIRDSIQGKDAYKITFRDTKDVLLAEGSEILKENAAEVTSQSDLNGYPITNLNISNVDKLKEITTNLSSASSNEEKRLVIWVGFEEGVDSYANKDVASTSKKIIYDASVSEPLDEETIIITGSYTKEAAKNTANLINSGTYNYDLEIVYTSTVEVDDAIKTRNLMLISILVEFILLAIALIVIFRFQGLIASFTYLVSNFIVIYLFNMMKGIVNYQVVIAFMLFNVIMFGLLYMLLSKYKNNLKVSKSPIKAYKETYKKNLSILFDTSITILIFALVTYFLGNNSQFYAILLATSAVSLFVSLVLVNRLSMYLTCDYKNKSDTTVLVSSNYKNDEEVNYDSKYLEMLDSKSKPMFKIISLVISLATVIVIATTLIFKAPFTFYGDSKKETSIKMDVSSAYFNNNNEVIDFFKKDSIEIDVSNVVITNTDEGRQVISLNANKVGNKEKVIKEELKTIFGENSEYSENYILYINEYNPSIALISLTSYLYTSLIAVVVLALYFALRYKYSYALSLISSVVVTLLTLVSIFAITRVPVNSNSLIAISLIASFMTFSLVALFTKTKEYMNETKKAYLSNDERVYCFKKAREAMFKPMFVFVAALVCVSIILLGFNITNFSMYLAIIVGAILSFVFNQTVAFKVWLLFENRIDKRRKTFKNRNIANSKYRTKDEQVFIGIND